MRLWAQYQVRAADIWRNVTGRDTPLMLWTSDLTQQEDVSSSTLPPSQYIIQVRESDGALKLFAESIACLWSGVVQ